MTDSGVDPTHSYYEAKSFTVTLTTTDDKGATNTEKKDLSVSLYPDAGIGPVTEKCLEFANMPPREMEQIYDVIKQVLNVEQIKSRRQGKDEDALFKQMNILAKQLDLVQRDEDLHEIDIVGEYALSEGEELYVDFAGGIATILIQFLTGTPAPFIGEPFKWLGFEIGETLVLSDIRSATITYPEIGRMEIILRKSTEKMWVNVYLEEPFNKRLFIIIPVEFEPLRNFWGGYVCSPMWCGLTCPATAAMKEPVPKLEDVEINIIGSGSPCELRVYDSHGGVTGLVEGEVKQEIPESGYVDGTVVIFASPEAYRYEVIGTNVGTYRLASTSIENGELVFFIATDIPTSTNATHQYTVDWDALSRGEEGLTVQVDSDGDGVFELTFTSDSKLTEDEFILQLPTRKPLPIWVVGAAVAAIATVTAAIAVFWRKRKNTQKETTF